MYFTSYQTAVQQLTSITFTLKVAAMNGASLTQTFLFSPNTIAGLLQAASVQRFKLSKRHMITHLIIP